MLSTIAVAKPSHIAQIQKIQVYIDMEASGPDNITINGKFLKIIIKPKMTYISYHKS